MLYTTGHDATEVYVLGVPDTGDKLNLFSITPVEAEGQGIAWDPAQPEVLYTINRSKREVVASRMRTSRSPPR